MSDQKKDLYNNDSFWDLSSYKKLNNIPTSKGASYRHPPVQPVHIDLSQEQNSGDSQNDKDKLINKKPYTDAGISPSKPTVDRRPLDEKNLILEYSPKNPLIKSVKIYSDKGEDSVFAKNNLFMRERAALLNRAGQEVPHVPFYSMMPRYSQMTRPQLAYYLWWRENIRRGLWLECDLSYVLLYTHELISADNDEDKNAILKKLCELYRAEPHNGRLSHFGMENMICDYCLVNNLDLPGEYIGDKRSDFISYSNFPEFFVDLSDRYNTNMHSMIIDAASIYNYRKSKHYPGHEKLFDECISGAVGEIFKDNASYERILSFTGNSYSGVTYSRKPFYRLSGMICRQAKIDIEYYSLSSFRPFITDAIRYIENKVREHLGIKSKLNITTVNPDLKTVIDKYMEDKFPPVTKEKIRANADRREEEKYNSLYDIPKTELSLEHARKIEQASWETTKILIEAFEDETENYEQNAEIAVTENLMPDSSNISAENIPPHTENTSSLKEKIMSGLGKNSEFFVLCIEHDIDGQKKFAASRSLTIHELAEEINEIALTELGDILVEDNGDGYEVIEDYKEQL